MRGLVVCFLYFLIFEFPPNLFANDAMLTIESKALLLPPCYRYGKPGVNKEGIPTKGGMTKEEAEKRTRVGIAEQIKLNIKRKKPGGYLGQKRNVKWTITEGNAYFGIDHAGKALETKIFRGEYSVLLNMRVSGPENPNPAKVVVTVTTKPEGVDDANTASGKIIFWVYRPTGDYTSRHATSQTPDGEKEPNPPRNSIPPDVEDHQDTVPKGIITGAWTTLFIFPYPTNVNFGGKGENGVWAIERDGNPKGKGILTPIDGNLFSVEHKGLGREYQKVNEFGHIEDSIWWYKENWAGFVVPSSTYYCKWICNWYYRDGNSAKKYNDSGEVANPAPPSGNSAPEPAFGFNLFMRVEQKFTKTSDYTISIEKFKSTVTRILRQNIYNQTLTGN